MDWGEHLLLLDFSDDDLVLTIPPSSTNNNQFPPPPLLSVEDIENLLFKDDDDDASFFDDILLDSPEKSGEVVNLPVPSSSDDHNNNQQPATAAAVDLKDKSSSSSDHDNKKRKRQLRNKDAAVRSRERKNMHIKDLEMKSRYFEGEFRRLGSLLQWYMAENQALRFSLHTTTSTSTNASFTRQESAVLFLESLLLGSLLWLMGIMVVLPSLVLLLVPHHQSQSQPLTIVEEKHLPNLALRKEGSRTLFVGKRFKASRSRMRRFLQVVSNILPVS